MSSICFSSKRKLIVSVLFFFSAFATVNAQNYKALSKMLYGSTSSEKELKLRQVFEYYKKTELLLHFERVEKELKDKSSIKNERLIEFNKNYKRNKPSDPKKSAACLDFKSYERKYKSQSNTVSKINAMAAMARTSLKLCRSSIYTKKNCSSQLNNYNRQVALYNKAVYLLKQYENKANYYLDVCNRKIKSHNKQIKKENDYVSLFRAKEKALNNSLGIAQLKKDYKQSKLAILKFLSDKYYTVTEKYSNGKARVAARFAIIAEKKIGEDAFYTNDNDYYDYGKRIGIWKFYTDKGKLKTLVTYGEYETILKQIDYYTNGNKIRIKTYKGKKMLLEDFYPNGLRNSIVEKKQLPKSKRYVFDGKATFYYKNGNIKEVNLYEKGKIVARWNMYLKNGKQTLKNGNGKYYQYDDFGNLTVIQGIRNGGRDGLTTWYFGNGKIKMKAIYKYSKALSPLGLRWEVLAEYDKNGKSLKKGTLKNGNGTWNIYDDFGQLLRTSIYKNGYKVN